MRTLHVFLRVLLIHSAVLTCCAVRGLVGRSTSVTGRKETETSAVSHQRPVPRTGRHKGPYKPGDPPSWTRKYTGKPSAKCLSEPATDELLTGEDLEGMPVLSETTIIGTDGPALLKPGAEPISPRQEQRDFDLYTEMFAHYYFHCPVGGSLDKPFMWGAGYRFGERIIRMVHMLHIDQWLYSVFDSGTGNWFTTFEHKWCTPIGNLECRYTAIGHVSGNVTATRIRMDLHVDNIVVRDNPYVFESCAPIGTLDPGIVGHSCSVLHVNVRHIPRESLLVTPTRTLDKQAK